jgi:hypothetical protein
MARSRIAKVYRTTYILAIAVLFLLVSRHASAQVLNAQEVAPIEAAPSTAPDQSSLELPILTGPQLPPAPAALPLPEVPSPFLGCWEGNPGSFDTVATDVGMVDIGAPGRIVFCYYHHSIDVPEAKIAIGFKGHALDLLIHLGLGFSTYKAHGVSTSVFAITPTQIRARTTLVIVQTEHWLYVIPSHTDQPCEVDWQATLTAPDTTVVQGRQIIFTSGLKMWGAWHGTFHRITDDTNG